MISTGGHLTILESVDSTNNYAMGRVRTGLAKHGDGFFAMAQVQGKGQRGKGWVTERGTNIIITLVMRPGGLQLQQQFQLSTAVALAAHDFFAHYAGDETSIKWPNDIYWRDRKAGGILIENIIVSRQSSDVRENDIRETSDISTGNGNTDGNPANLTSDASRLTSWQWAIIGMGININQTAFSESIRNAVSLKQITGKDWDVVALAKELCGYVQNRYEQLLAGNDLLQEYNERLYKKGQNVKFKQGSRVFEGMVKEVNFMGELVVLTAIEEHFDFGEVEWVLK
jgi:BirA family transcriptional regulator, biotin operon repressor / biotin---[acetyl-CoA-carboxylase] ligase